MKETPQLILYAIGGTFVLLLVYALRDYLVIGMVSCAMPIILHFSDN